MKQLGSGGRLTDPYRKYISISEMDRHHPRLEAADDIEGNAEALRDLEDDFFMEGQRIIEGIRTELVTSGRRRRPVE